MDNKYLRAIDYKDNLAEFLNQYNYQPGLTPKLDNLGGKPLNQKLINEITLWKVNRYFSIPPEILQKIEGIERLKKREHRKTEDILEKLLKIKGIDLPMASTLLRFRNPEVFQIVDRHAYRAIYGQRYPLYGASPIKRKTSIYFDYLDKLINLCKKRKLEFKTIDRLLYIFDKKINKNLPKTKKK